MVIRIKNLRLRTIIGIHDWERKAKQDVIINVTIDFDGAKAGESDQIEDTVDYKTITKKIISEVESSSYYLIEKLSTKILNLIMEDHRVNQVAVEIDKPFALRYSDSVSVSCSAER